MSTQQSHAFDLLVRGGDVLDGLGSPPRRADVGVKDGRIVAIEPDLPAEAAAVVVEAVGRVVAPGFVDLHAHSDVSILSEPGCISAIEQGITTQAVGLCGFSAAPATAESLAGLIDEEPVFAFPGVEWTWSSMSGYAAAIQRARPAMNVASFVGHNSVRRAVMGMDDRVPNGSELDQMRDFVRAAIREGARGFTSGLSYAPGLFAAPEELVQLARVAAEEGRPYHTHMRYEGGVEPSLDEAIRTARDAGVVLNVSHLYPRPDDPPGAADRLIERLEAARGSGLEVTWDVTVFPRGGGAFMQSLPRWARDGGMARTVERIRDPGDRARLIALLEGPETEAWVKEWDDHLIVKVNRPENEHLLGRSIGQIAAERGLGGAETALDLVAEDGQYWIAPHIKLQADLDRMIGHPLGVPVTDGFAAHPDRHRHLGIMPKSFGSFPLILGAYVRERSVFSLSDGVRKLTALPAARLGLSDRGRLERGLVADLVVFDPATVGNRATDLEPAIRPAGIDHVFVGGRWAVRDGAATDERAGTMLA
jgi:N-acyl-D-amino-acid deacylase